MKKNISVYISYSEEDKNNPDIRYLISNLGREFNIEDFSNATVVVMFYSDNYMKDPCCLRQLHTVFNDKCIGKRFFAFKMTGMPELNDSFIDEYVIKARCLLKKKDTNDKDWNDFANHDGYKADLIRLSGYIKNGMVQDMAVLSKNPNILISGIKDSAIKICTKCKEVKEGESCPVCNTPLQSIDDLLVSSNKVSKNFKICTKCKEVKEGESCPVCNTPLKSIDDLLVSSNEVSKKFKICTQCKEVKEGDICPICNTSLKSIDEILSSNKGNKILQFLPKKQEVKEGESRPVCNTPLKSIDDFWVSKLSYFSFFVAMLFFLILNGQRAYYSSMGGELWYSGELLLSMLVLGTISEISIFLFSFYFWEKFDENCVKNFVPLVFLILGNSLFVTGYFVSFLQYSNQYSNHYVFLYTLFVNWFYIWGGLSIALSLIGLVLFFLRGKIDRLVLLLPCGCWLLAYNIKVYFGDYEDLNALNLSLSDLTIHIIAIIVYYIGFFIRKRLYSKTNTSE